MGRWPTVAISILLFLGTTGCQFTYLVKSGYEQAKILARRVPLEEALNDASTSEDVKSKLRLAREAREFAERHLGLTKTNNYTSFVTLDRPYVSYVISAAPEYKLEAYLWSYPIVGSLPYKGFFEEAEAKEEATKMHSDGFDTHVRGVSAYSTLGYFNDPILSSMVRYKDEDLVNLIIHESVHATLYVKSSADFNERMAVFLGNKGTEAFYREKEGPNSKMLQKIQDENHDEDLFSAFLSIEIEALKKWYAEEKSINPHSKKTRIKEIQRRFSENLKPKMKTGAFVGFERDSLNNADLLLYGTYSSDLKDFDRLYQSQGGDFHKTLDALKSLKSVDDPSSALKLLAK